MLGIRLGAAFVLLLASVNIAAAACQGDIVLFQDRFDSLQPTWGEATDSFKVEDGRLVMTPAPANNLWVTNRASLYDDIDMCVSMTTVTGVEAEEAKAGLVFWHVDANNFYVFELAPNGKASVWRRQRGKWLEQVDWKDVAGAATGDGGTNELRVVTKGNEATLFVNETEFAKFTGMAPDNGQQIGVFAESPEAGAARYAFDDLKITRP
jgi:hypothetical protein